MGNGIAACIAALPAAGCWLEARLTRNGETVFSFWTHIFALIPGLLGTYARRAFYRFTLDSCSWNCFIGFGALFSHRRAIIENGVYVGTYSLIGSAWLQEGSLIGSRVSILSGPALHDLDQNGHWLPTDLSRMQQIQIGAHCWIGEGAIIMADIGAGSMVAAGSVCSSPVRSGVVVAGNPARYARTLRSEPDVQYKCAD